MDTVSLKKYIYENNKIEYVLQEIGCGNIKYHSNKEFYAASNHNGDNPGAVNVKNCPQLWVTNWTRQNEFPEGSDIFNLVQYSKQCSFVESVKYLHKILDLDYSPYKKQEKKEKFDPLNVFKRVLSARRRVDVNEIHAISDEALNDYVPMLHISWFREGVMPWTREKFGIAYSYKHKRVVIPHRYWLTGELLGFNMRSTVENFEQFGISKYLITKNMNKSMNVYGYYENSKNIEGSGYCVLYEGEKSVLKRDSLNDSTGLALSGKSISNEQVRIILSLNINEVVIAFDKDVAIDEVRHACEKFYNFRKVSYIYDKWNLLDNKQSPADAKNKVFNFLFKYRIKYDENEHDLYLDSLGRKNE